MSRKLKSERAVYLIAHRNPKSLATEQYRLIRNNIQFSSVDKKIKTIVVTSPEPSDGKSTTAANLAVVLAQQGKQVLLIDADLRKPSVHYTFNVSNIHGLTSVLTKKINLEQAFYKSTIPNLDVLTSGPIPPNPSELLDSNAMEMMIEQLKGMFEYIVFDTPPILIAIDSQIMANKCDGVIMIVASGKTHKDIGVKAKDRLHQANAHVLGVVVNGIESTNNRYRYYDQYE